MINRDAAMKECQKKEKEPGISESCGTSERCS